MLNFIFILLLVFGDSLDASRESISWDLLVILNYEIFVVLDIQLICHLGLLLVSWRSIFSKFLKISGVVFVSFGIFLSFWVIMPCSEWSLISWTVCIRTSPLKPFWLIQVPAWISWLGHPLPAVHIVSGFEEAASAPAPILIVRPLPPTFGVSPRPWAISMISWPGSLWCVWIFSFHCFISRLVAAPVRFKLMNMMLLFSNALKEIQEIFI